MCVCVRERESVCVCVCVCVRESGVCVVCERERERSVQVYISWWGLKPEYHRLMGTLVTVGTKIEVPMGTKASKSYRMSFLRK